MMTEKRDAYKQVDTITTMLSYSLEEVKKPS